MAHGDPGTARGGGAEPHARFTSFARVAWYARPALAGLLLLIVVLGCRAAFPSLSASGRWHADGFALSAGLDAVLVSLLVAVVWRRRWHRDPGYPAAELSAWLKNILAVAVTVVTALAVLALLGAKLGAARVRPLRLRAHPFPTETPLPSRRLPSGPAVSAAAATDVLYGVAALLVLAAIAASAYLLWMRRNSLSQAGEPEIDADDDAAALRDAVASGRSALHVLDDSRAAIIACYAAMETSLAGAGTARTVAETPDELLGRARQGGLLRGPAAAALVSLFYEARFSSHPMPARARDAASIALDEIAAELRDAPARASSATPGQGA